MQTTTHPIRRIILLCGIVWSAVSCTKHAPTIDSTYAARVVQRELSLQGKVTAEELHGGFSAKLFLVTADHQKYVIRFMHRGSAHNEVVCMKIASDVGYGPHVYRSNEGDRYIIMEYLPKYPITREERLSPSYYRALGAVVAKMHHGPAFPKAEDSFTHARHEIRRLKRHEPFGELASRFEEMLSTIQQAVAPYLEKAACHNDLHPNNFIYNGTSFKIIDFEDASEDDPYFDIATVLVFNCFGNEQRDAFLNSYFGREMTTKEKAKLYLMEQAVRMRNIAGFLIKLPKRTYDLKTKTLPYAQFCIELSKGNLNLEDPDVRFRFALSILHDVDTNVQSPEFAEAIKQLQLRDTQ